ncbi:MAG: molecular chaperone DnaJ [Bacteroidetes bacterium]|nr:molecular chaperone DnaJ [Bacteroidota bacterium]
MIDLLERLPKEEKATAPYNKNMALALDSLKRYASAIKYYNRYLDLVKDSAATQRLAFIVDKEEKRILAWKAKLIRIKDCPKCNGTDTVYTEMSCMSCGGAGQIRKPCSRCQGRAIVACSTCMGKGSLPSPNGPIPCGSCQGGGTQRCNSCERGYNEESCSGCNGSRRTMTHLKCDLHD